MSNTKLRIISALTLTLIVISALVGGAWQTNTLLLIISILCLDEFQISFLKNKRFNFRYNLNQMFLITIYCFVSFVEEDFSLYFKFIYFSIVLNVFLVVYLFGSPKLSKNISSTISNKFFPIFLIFLLPALCISSFLFYGIWIKYLLLLFIINFGMDTGAWFFGRRYGKTKLWPSVSPNKTVEGLIGGSLCAGVLGLVFWNLAISFGNIKYFLIFVFFGIISQMGDLIQSKLKRHYEIKDSSGMIPGHGGVYDRVDSLLFVVPFYSLFIYYCVN